MRLTRSIAALLFALPFALGLSGCSTSFAPSPSAAAPAQTTGSLSGTVRGGQQPLKHAQLYLYAVNTTGWGANSVPLLNANVLINNPLQSGIDLAGHYYVVTNDNGAFNISNDYTCTEGQQVYILVTGGDPGSGTQNTAINLMAVVGTCPAAGTLAGVQPHLVVNEVTTAAAAFSLAGYAGSPTQIADDEDVAGNTTAGQAALGLTNAVGNVSNLISIYSGLANTNTPSGSAIAPQAMLNAIGNILSLCVNSTGPSSTGCNKLFTAATSDGTPSGTQPQDTATAAINIAHHPGAPATLALVADQVATSPFQPTLATSPLPNDLALSLTYTGGGTNADSCGVAIDAAGNAWIAVAFTDSVAINNGNGVVVEIASAAPTETSVQPSSYLSGQFGYITSGLLNPYSLAIDLSGNVWITNNSFFNNGVNVTELSSSGRQLNTIGIDPEEGSAALIAINPVAGAANPVWVTMYASSRQYLYGYVTAYSTSGAAAAGAPFEGDVYSPAGIAVDSVGNAWVADEGGGETHIDELAKDGSTLSPSGGYMSSALEYPFDIAIDASNSAWITDQSGNVIGKVNTAGSQIFSGTLNGPTGVAIDGVSNVWVANNGSFVRRSDGTLINAVSEFSNSGAILAPNGYTGGDAMFASQYVAVDPSGDIWVTNDNSVSELIGAAAPVITPLASAVANNKIGARP